MLVNGPIIWSIKKKSDIALSSTELEYIGIVNAATQRVWLHGLLGQFGIESNTSTVIFCENKITIRISIDLV